MSRMAFVVVLFETFAVNGQTLALANTSLPIGHSRNVDFRLYTRMGRACCKY